MPILDDDFNNQLKALNIDYNKLLESAINKTEELLKGGFIIEAEIIAKQILIVDPDNLPALQLQGLILFRNRKYKEAIEIINRAIKLDDSNAENHNNIALCYLHSGQSEIALTHIAKAKRLSPENFNFMNNAGLILRSMGHLSEAISNFKLAIKTEPNNSRSWENLGSLYGQKKMLAEATDCFNKAIELDPTNLGAHVDLAYAYHLNGNWEEAWVEYEARLEYWYKEGRNPGKFYDIYKPDKKWDGKASLEGKKLVVYCEQGNGDMIQFVRFVPLLVKLGAAVIIDTPQELVALFDGFGTIRTNYNDGLEYDYHCSILSLPFLLKLSKEQLNAKEPYLEVESNEFPEEYNEFFKIGIVWAGNPGHPNDANRSVYLSNFKSIAQLSGVKLFSFQKELGKRVYAHSDVQIDLTENCEDMRLVDLSVSMADFKATANLLSHMDLLITVDTSVLHLAGAIGKETYALIPYNPDWRWGISGSDNVWYPTVTLFRQEEPGDWASVFSTIESKVNDLLQNKRQ